MSSGPDQTLDVAIIGGGVSGLYAAWRLAKDASDVDPSRIAVFEASDRLGGRLWSVGMEGEESIPAELGGMFFSDAQPLVYNLCKTRLQLETHTVSPKPDFAYLRRKRFLIGDFDKPGVAPYNLTPEEQGKPYHELLFLALGRIVPGLERLWPLNPDADFTHTLDYLRGVKFEDRLLFHWGFWNLLSKVISNEAYLCLRDMVSSYAMFNNANGFDAVFATLCELTGNWLKLPRGYETLPLRLADEARSTGVRFHVKATAVALSDANKNGDLSLHYEVDSEVHRVRARRVILALPKDPLQRMLRASKESCGREGLDELDAVAAVPACKLFLTFDDPWWREVPDGPGKVDEGTFSVSHTDLPMRQCYYLGADPKTGEGLLLASYSDAQSVPFWATLLSDSGREPALTGTITAAARLEIQRQLSEMHGIAVPAPKEGLYVDWARPPFGGGWHAWRPGWESVEVMRRLRQGKPNATMHICGETFCAYPGWVEGALTSTEVLLQELGLAAPDWLPSTQCLAPYYSSAHRGD